MILAEDLAADLGVDPGDVRAVVESIVDLHDEGIPDEIAAEVRAILDPHGERTAPARLYWPGHEETDELGSRGIGSLSPTRGEGIYPE